MAYSFQPSLFKRSSVLPFVNILYKPFHKPSLVPVPFSSKHLRLKNSNSMRYALTKVSLVKALWVCSNKYSNAMWFVLLDLPIINTSIWQTIRLCMPRLFRNFNFGLLFVQEYVRPDSIHMLEHINPRLPLDPPALMILQERRIGQFPLQNPDYSIVNLHNHLLSTH